MTLSICVFAVMHMLCVEYDENEDSFQDNMCVLHVQCSPFGAA